MNATPPRRWFRFGLRAMFLAVALFAVCMWWLFGLTGDVALNVDAPSEVQIGEAFEVRVVVRNPSAKQNAVFTGVDFAGYTRGASLVSIVSSKPAWMNEDYSQGSTLYHYGDIDLAPLAELTVDFMFRAEHEGVYASDVIAMTKGWSGVSSSAARTRIRINVVNR